MTRRAFLVSLGAILGAETNFAQLPGAIEGKVLSAAGKPTLNATVHLDGQTRQLHKQTQTGASGQYSFEDLMPGHYTLWCELDGYGCIVYPNVVVNSGTRCHRDFCFTKQGRDCAV